MPWHLASALGKHHEAFQYVLFKRLCTISVEIPEMFKSLEKPHDGETLNRIAPACHITFVTWG